MCQVRSKDAGKQSEESTPYLERSMDFGERQQLNKHDSLTFVN